MLIENYVDKRISNIQKKAFEGVKKVVAEYPDGKYNYFGRILVKKGDRVLYCESVDSDPYYGEVYVNSREMREYYFTFENLFYKLKVKKEDDLPNDERLRKIFRIMKKYEQKGKRLTNIKEYFWAGAMLPALAMSLSLLFYLLYLVIYYYPVVPQELENGEMVKIEKVQYLPNDIIKINGKYLINQRVVLCEDGETIQRAVVGTPGYEIHLKLGDKRTLSRHYLMINKHNIYPLLSKSGELK